MARTNATNFSGALQFPYATAAADIFKKEDVQTLAQAVDQHDHTTGKGLSVAPANASITNAKLGSDVARANLLSNPGFEVWQRGPGPYTTGVYGVDRWIASFTGSDTYSLSRDTANVDVGSGACAALSFTLGSGAGASNIQQTLKATDGYAQLQGRTLSFSIRVKTATANAIRAAMTSDGTGNSVATSSFHTGGGAYQTLTVTYAVPANASFINTYLLLAATHTSYLDNACLVVGSQPADYVPLHPADDLARCLRYYEIPGQGAGYLHGGWSGVASEAIGSVLRWQALKPVVPTVTKVGTWNVTNCAQPTIGPASVDGANAFALSSGIGHTQFWSSASAYYTVEANP